MSSKGNRKKSAEEIENEILPKEFLESSDYDYRRNTISEEPTYTLFLTIGEYESHFDGICKIEVILIEDFTDLFFDFRGEIHRIWVNKTVIYYNHESPDCSHLYNGSVLVIEKSFLKPHLNSISIEYRCKYMAESKGLHFVPSKEEKQRFFYTLSEPNHSSFFMPIIGQLNVKGSFKLYINHPPDFRAISNNEVKFLGSLKEDSFYEGLLERFEKVSKYHFWSKIRMRYFESEYVVTEFHTTGILCFNMFAFAVGSFERTETLIKIENRTLNIGFLTRAEWTGEIAKVKDTFAGVIQFGIQYFETLTNKTFPYKKYDTLFVKEFHLDAIETPGMVIMYEEYIKFKELHAVQQLNIIKVFLHEIAHMWFGMCVCYAGNLVSINWWSDLWIKEGISEYMAYIVIEEMSTSPLNTFMNKEVLSSAWLVFNSHLLDSFEFELENLIPLNPLVPDTHDIQKYYNPVPYQKGAMFCRTLHLLIGNKSFRGILRKITNFYSHHNISTSILYNLIRVMIRNFDEEDVCLLNEDLFEKFWNDYVLLPFYSAIRLTRFEHLDNGELVVHFEGIERLMGFDESIEAEFFAQQEEGEEEEMQEETIPGKKPTQYHSADELASNMQPPIVLINRNTVRRRHNFFQLLVFDSTGAVRFESWCRLSLYEDKQIKIPGLDFEPEAVLINSRFENYSRVYYDERSLDFLINKQNILHIKEDCVRLSVYLSIIHPPPKNDLPVSPTLEKNLHKCILKDTKTMIKLLSTRTTLLPH